MARRKIIVWTLAIFCFLGTGAVLAPMVPAGDEDFDTKKKILLNVLKEGLSQYHYQPREIDNTFSEQVFDTYLRRIDPGKRFFLQEDLKAMGEYRTLIDDEINASTFRFFDMSYEKVQQRIQEAKGYYEEIIEQPFDFESSEELELKYEDLDYPASAAEQKDAWRRFVKFYALRNLYQMEKEQAEKVEKGTLESEPKTFAEMEEKARNQVKKNFDRYFKDLSRLEPRDRLSDYLNAITAVYDPHTTYYAPKAKEDFDLEFSGRMEGIGARLTEKDDYITVASIVVGSACWRQGDLEVDDIILKVAQDKEEPVDIVGMRIDDAVQLIRGPKDTKVILTVKKKNGTIQDIPIIRDVVEFEHNYARSAVIEKDGLKVGYIKLPSFYADFNELGGRRCATDVKAEILKLKGEGVEELVLDLRNNGGGSLGDVIEMAGLFIPQGPIVQVKAGRGPARVLEDTDPSVVWEGPLVVMVNTQSASASEILAGAIQDYGRGIIIGVGNRTFGKGTVQQIIDMDRLIRPNMFEELKPLGSVMLTTQKFYRIDGTTNQLKGVIPDITLPDSYSYIESGEKELDYAIPWDEIKPADYEEWNRKMENLDKLRASVDNRLSEDPRFSIINQNALRLKEQQEDRSVPLQFAAYKAQQQKLEAEADDLDALQEEIPGLTIITPQADLPEYEADSAKYARNEAMQKSLRKDIYLNEAINVLEGLEID